jgi:hypothetical protein
VREFVQEGPETKSNEWMTRVPSPDRVEALERTYATFLKKCEAKLSRIKADLDELESLERWPEIQRLKLGLQFYEPDWKGNPVRRPAYR